MRAGLGIRVTPWDWIGSLGPHGAERNTLTKGGTHDLLGLQGQREGAVKIGPTHGPGARGRRGESPARCGAAVIAADLLAPVPGQVAPADPEVAPGALTADPEAALAPDRPLEGVITPDPPMAGMVLPQRVTSTPPMRPITPHINSTEEGPSTSEGAGVTHPQVMGVLRATSIDTITPSFSEVEVVA